MRWLLALISETGMRLSEAAGLHRDDIILDAPIPHISLTAHPWRRLKTKSSARHIPLVGMALWAAKRLMQNDSIYAFSRYCDGKTCNANSASAYRYQYMESYSSQVISEFLLSMGIGDRVSVVIPSHEQALTYLT